MNQTMELTLKEMETFRDRLRQEKERRDIETNEAFGKLLGVSGAYVGQIFSAKRIGYRSLNRFAKKLNLSPAFLIGYDETPRLKNLANIETMNKLGEILDMDPQARTGIVKIIIEAVNTAYNELVKKKEVVACIGATIISILPYLNRTPLR